MTQKEFDIIHNALGYALKNNIVKPNEYDLAMRCIFKEYPDFRFVCTIVIE